jgi:acetylserotonin N-methyltransferase
MSLAVNPQERAEREPATRQDNMQQLFGMIMGFATTQMILTADELGVFNALADGPRTTEEIARSVGAPADSLERLLNAACAYALLRKHEGGYMLTELSREHLVKGAPAYMGGFFGHLRNELYALWAHLPSAVREAKPQWQKLPGMNAAGPFEAMYKDEAGVRCFMDAMFAATYPSACEFAHRFDFSQFKHIVDVGGASGAFFSAVLAKYTGTRGTIFDLPPVGPVALETMKRFNLQDRVAFAGGDFFKDALPAGDMYVLGYILHDWDTEQGTQLLKKIYDALPKGGAVFICETLYNSDKTGPAYAGWSDLNMLVATTGRERTPAEYEAWLRQIGFSRTEHQVCNGPKSFVVGYK